MKLSINNLTDRDVRPYLELAAQVVSVAGPVRAKVHYVKRGAWRWYSGCADYVANRVRIGIPRDEFFKPFSYEHLGYFRSQKIPLHQPYRIDTVEELLVGIAAHEFAHLMPAGHKFRKSVMELFCEKKCAEAVELLRSEKGQHFIAHFHDNEFTRAEARSAKQAARLAFAASPQGQHAHLLALRKRWTTRAKRAATAIKKIDRKLKRLAPKLVS